MRELEFQTQVLTLLTRIADSCERAELRLPDEAADLRALELDALTASTEAECGPLGGTSESRPRGKRRSKRA